MNRLLASLLLTPALALAALAQTNPAPWPAEPLSLNHALDLALRQSPAILKGRQDLAESHGLALQLRSVALPRLRGAGNVRVLDEEGIETANFGGGAVQFQQDKSWAATIELAQPIFTAGRMSSSLRAAKLTREAALAQFQALVADALLEIRVAYDDALLAAEQIGTQEASVELLTRELEDQKRRYEAGTVPKFNVLRAEVELANARPRLIRARNALRIARNNLATLLGWNVPADTGLDIPLALADRLTASAYEVELANALVQAFQRRPELAALRTRERLRDEDIKQARADYFPQLSASAGWNFQSKVFTDDLDEYVNGWLVGARLDWSIWDFGLTKGKVDAARARREKARLETEDTFRRIELEVRTAHSNFIEAKEVLESQQKVIEQAEEALRLATVRAEAGTGTQLDVLSAQTALTESRNTYSQALRDYAVAQARLERAIGADVQLGKLP